MDETFVQDSGLSQGNAFETSPKPKNPDIPQKNEDGGGSRHTTFRRSNQSRNADRFEIKRLLNKRVSDLRKDKYLSSGYKDELNSTILDAAISSSSDYDGLSYAARMGASLWTASEKDALFSKLARVGAHDLSAISVALPSKSLPQIEAYLALLVAGSIESAATLATKDSSVLESIPAAYEISDECEKDLSLAARALRRYVASHDDINEQEVHGDGYRIDSDVARNLEHRASTYTSASLEGEAADEPNNFHPSERLLNAATMLQLSRSLFMNSASDDTENWHDLMISEPEDCLCGPSIYRTAFEDFYSLAVSLTRRLVQSAIFQALTRLRAKDELGIAPLVRSVDVRTATDILGLKVRRDEYWATIARRCGVRVFSTSKKFLDGRAQTALGGELAYREVESEMGYHDSAASEEPPSQLPENVDLGLVEQVQEDSDQWTTEMEDSDTEKQNLTDSEDSESTSWHELPKESSPHRKRALSPDAIAYFDSKGRKRQRQLSPRTRDLLEDQYLDALDQKASIEENQRLWRVIGREGDLPFEKSRKIPEQPILERKALDEVVGRKTTYHFLAPWENLGPGLGEAEFRKMNDRGCEARKKRRLVRSFLRHNGQHHEADDDDSVSQEDGAPSPASSTEDRELSDLS